MNEATTQQDYDRDGFVILPQFVDAAEVDAIRAALDAFIADRVPHLPPEHVFYEDKERPETLKQIQQLYEYDGFFRNLMMDSPFQRVAETVLRGSVVPKNMQYFNKAPGVSLATPPHQDGFYFNLTPCEAVTLWFALDPVDDENGCVRYARASHKKGLLPHRRTTTLGFSQGLENTSLCDDPDTMVACHAAPGDLLAHHALTVHWADSNRSTNRTRRALGFIYYGVNAEEDTARHAAYQEALTRDLRAQSRI